MTKMNDIDRIRRIFERKKGRVEMWGGGEVEGTIVVGPLFDIDRRWWSFVCLDDICTRYSLVTHETHCHLFRVYPCVESVVVQVRQRAAYTYNSG